jgi:hypothetical protein
MSFRQKQRLRRFGLRSLIALVTIIGVLLAIIVPRIQNQANAVSEIQSLGGSVWFEHDAPAFVEFWQNPERNKGIQPVHSEWITAVFGDDSFRTLVQADFGNISRSAINETESKRLIKRLNRVGSLETIRMASLSIDQPTFKMLSYLEHVKNLTFDQCEISDDNLKYISQMDSLESLNISNSRVTDEGVQYLKTMDNLERLRLYSLEITPTGLETILAIPNLRELILYDCNMTLEEFQSATNNPKVIANIYYVHRKINIDTFGSGE